MGITWAPLAILLVLAISVVFTAGYGWVVERIAYRPLRGSFRLAPLISAIGRVGGDPGASQQLRETHAGAEDRRKGE